MAANEPIVAFAGNSIVIRISVQNPDASPFDLTGAQSIDYAFASTYADKPLVTKTLAAGVAVPSPATGGIFEVTLDEADTAGLRGVYYQEAKLVDQFGNVVTCYAASLTLNPTLLP